MYEKLVLVNQTPVTYATTLPASPFDGQQAILVDSVTAPTYQWWFRYNAGSSNTDKWEFVGGAPLTASNFASSTTASTTAADLAAGASPTFTLPRSGAYIVSFSCMATNSSANTQAVVYVVLNGVTQFTAAEEVNTAAINHSIASAPALINGTVGQVVKLQYSVAAGTGTFQARIMSIIPVRVS